MASQPDVPKKTATRIVELLDRASTLYNKTDPADIPKAVLWFATEVVGSKKFPKGIEEYTTRQLALSFFEELVDPDDDSIATNIAQLSREFRHQLRFGERTGIGRSPGCTIF